MDMWKLFKDNFDNWEAVTSKYAETLLKSPLVLQPAGATLTAWARAKRMQDDMLARWWSRGGLPTRREQERVLHALNQLQSRLFDLEEQIEDLQDALEAAQNAPVPTPPPAKAGKSKASKTTKASKSTTSTTKKAS